MKFLPLISLCAVCLVLPAQGQLFSDDFTRGTDPGPLTPWTTNLDGGKWTVTGGVMKGGTNATFSYGFTFVTNTFTNFSVQARLQFPVGAYGGGLGGRLNPATGTRYAVWVYPENSLGGSNVLKLLKFSNFSSFSVLQQTNLAAVGTSFHTVKLEFASASQVNVYFDSTKTAERNRCVAVRERGGEPGILDRRRWLPVYGRRRGGERVAAGGGQRHLHGGLRAGAADERSGGAGQ